MRYESLYADIINRLESGLPAFITYHNAEHTKAVVAAAEHLALKENISGDDLILLKTAALLHDVGFLQSHKDHEMLSCRFAEKTLPGYGYTDEAVEKISLMIMATKLPQAPQDLLSMLLCDADLYYLGGEQYSEFAIKLFAEFRRNGIVKTAEEWTIRQSDFLGSHRYFTKTAIAERNDKKQENLNELRSGLASMMSLHKKSSPREILQDVLFIVFGVIIAACALKFFLVPNRFFDGGVTGASLLLHELYHFHLAGLIIVLNLPLIAVSYFTIGKKFAVRTLLSVVLLGICLWQMPDYALTSDKLLIAVFGGVFLGIGIGLVMRAGAALDGIEVLALYTLKRTSFTITEIILGLNVLIFTIAAFSFGIETSLYSILTYFAATRSIDYVVEGIQAYTGVTIISGKSEVIKYELVNNLGRGITVFKGERGFLPGQFDVSADCDIIFTVITRMELRKLKNLVYDADPKAFIFANTIKETSGGIIKRRNKH